MAISINVIWIMQCKLARITFQLLLALAFYLRSSFFSFSFFFVLLKDTLAADSVTLTLMSHSSFEVSAIVLLVRLQHIAANWLWMLTAGSSSRQHFSHRLS